MIRRLFIRGIIHTILQLLFYVGSLALLWVLVSLLTMTSQPINELAFWMSLILFSMLLLIQNLLTALVTWKWFYFSMLAVAAVLYAIGWGEDLDSFPLSTIVYLMSGFLTLGFKLYLDKEYLQKISTIPTPTKRQS